MVSFSISIVFGYHQFYRFPISSPGEQALSYHAYTRDSTEDMFISIIRNMAK